MRAHRERAVRTEQESGHLQAKKKQSSAILILNAQLLEL